MGSEQRDTPIGLIEAIVGIILVLVLPIGAGLVMGMVLRFLFRPLTREKPRPATPAEEKPEPKTKSPSDVRSIQQDLIRGPKGQSGQRRKRRR